MRIAVLYICTGKYSIFWDSFYNTAQDYFYPKAEKSYFIFTDDNELIKRVRGNNSIHPYFQRKAGWPYDTLLRFNSFSSVQDLLLDYDYCYFWNANTVFLKVIDDSVIPFPTSEKSIVLWRHTKGFDYDSPDQFQTEKNPESEAYIPKGSVCHNYGGGFIGGTANGFVKMSLELRDRIARDLQKGIIAIWHDQSHLVKYGMEVASVEVPKDVIVYEEYIEGKSPYVVFSNKERVGGMYKLRGMPLFFRIKASFIDLIRSILGALGLKPIVKKIISRG